MAYISGVEAGKWPTLHRHWWQWVLISLCLTAIIVGLAYIIFLIGAKLWVNFRRKESISDEVQARVANHLQKYVASRSQLRFERPEKKKPASLGIYLGSFDVPFSAEQKGAISGRDMIVLDALQTNIATTLSELCRDPQKSHDVIGRVDLKALLGTASPPKHKAAKVFIQHLDQTLSVVSGQFYGAEGRNNGFTSILLVGWEIFPREILHGLSEVLFSMGLEVFLETSAPNFLEDPLVLATESISGLVIRNGLLHANGERQDCFDMDALKITVKSFVSQSCVRDFTTLAWEAINDGVVLSNAVLKRTYNWCGFYNVIPWIGPQTALFDASIGIVPFEPLSAFAWLKEPRVMEIHELWKTKKTAQSLNYRHSVVGRLNTLLPSLEAARADCSCTHEDIQAEAVDHICSFSGNLEWFVMKDTVLGDPLSISVVGDSYDRMGCFPLGFDVCLDDFQEVVFSQRNLRKLELLDVVIPADLREYGNILSHFARESNSTGSSLESSSLGDSGIREDLKELGRILISSPDDGSEGVRIFLGLQSGFQRTTEKQFWAVYHVHPSKATIDIYISKNVDDVIGTLLHTYLSCQGYTRRQCFTTEVVFAQWNHSLLSHHNIPPRVVQDIEILSPAECLQLLRRVSFAPHVDDDPLLLGIKSAAMERLVDVPSWRQLKVVNTIGYLKEDVTVEDLVESRLQWHCQSQRCHPSRESAVAMFREVETKLVSALRCRNRQDLQTIVESLGRMLHFSTIGAIGDLLALAVFCTMRKLAFEEVYLEVTDRNPLFNDQTDQAAAFAELFALGSRCEAYFDVSPSKFGELLANKFRNHYSVPEHQPPMYKDTQVALSSAYSEAQIDIDPNYKPTEMPSYKRFTFLSVFAIPALIDILMLTFTGHGLYLSGHNYMTHEEQHSATTALMIALLLSGAIGTWISCGGTYYLASMAFSAMNYFVITRLLGGLAFTLLVGVVGFIAFACTTGAYNGLIFCLYLFALTTYLSLLAALANYQFTGSAFQSGRAVIICCVPVLFISPLITIFIPNHDVAIYLTVLYVFITLLLIGVRETGSRWTTWYQKIDLITDTELRNWYLDKRIASSRESLEKMSDPAILRLARQSLLHDVIVEQRAGLFTQKTQDPLVAKLVKSFKATHFLMDWYCRFSGVQKPILYSSAWNVQTKVALFSLQRSQLGIRFHNGFLHWRQAGDEIGCTMLYFVVALLDKWIQLCEGGGLGFGSSNQALTFPVGFGLAYYLVGAVLLDVNAHTLHELAAKNKEEIVPTDGDTVHAAKTKSNSRRILYWKTLARFLMIHIWALAIMSTLLWTFSTGDNSKETIVFLSYVSAYTGLLWYQYTKIFCGPHALKPLLIGVAVGLPVGFILDHTIHPNWIYGDIVALGAATWTVALLSLWAGRIIGPPRDRPRPMKSTEGIYHAYSGPGSDPFWSQPELQCLYETLSHISDKERLLVDPNSQFGSQVNLIFDQFSHTPLSEHAKRAFPEAATILDLARKLFKQNLLHVELVSIDHFAKSDQAMRAISCAHETSVKLIVACETKQVLLNQDPLQGFYWDVAELLIQVAAEKYLGYTAHDALLAQTLWLSNGVLSQYPSGPDILERQLGIHTEVRNMSNLLNSLRSQLLRDLCLGFDLNIDADILPPDIRTNLVSRCVGISKPFTADQTSFINKKLNHTPGLDFETYIARCNYSAFWGARAISRVTSWVNDHDPRGSYIRRSHEQSHRLPDSGQEIKVIDLIEHVSPPRYTIYDRVLQYSENAYHYAGKLCKFFSIAFVADPEYQRELKCAFPGNSNVGNSVTRFVLLAVWTWAKAIQKLLLPMILFRRRNNVYIVWRNLQGMEVSIKRKRVVIRNIDGVSTGFIHPVDTETFRLLQYRGDHKTEPATNADLIAINMYSTEMTLLRRVQMESGNTVNDYIYEYRTSNSQGLKRLSKSDVLTPPISRSGVAGRDHLQDVSYNSKGQIISGSYIKDGNLIRFQYHYQKSSDTGGSGGALLRAEFVLPHLSCTVAWCAPPRRKPEKLDSWIPHSQVTEATFVIGPDVWESKYFYDHKFHPTIVTTLNGQRVDTPDLIMYDHLDVLKKPKHISFLDDNPLLSFHTIRTTPFTRWLGVHTRKYPVSTSQTRSWLWRAWKDDPAFDGVIVRWLDERLLRRDPMLRPYWRNRDTGHLDAAEAYLDKNRDAVMASVDIDNTISSWTPLAVKINDLYSFGQGGDACSQTRSNVSSQEEDETALHVIAVDTGTWPNEGGGVSACRSDVINNLKTIKWHMVAESANDFGIPKRQIERNIHSLKIIPLWGLDLMTPTHGLFNNRLDSEVEHSTTHTTLLDIERTFVPILTALVRGSRALDFTMRDMKQATRALVNLNSYFKDSRHWSAVWGSDVVKSAWRNLWLSQTAPNARPSSEWLKTELPTLGQLDQGLELWSRYLFIYSIPIPEKMPAVFQASHHSVSASYGIVCKLKRGCTLQIWDHAISWRETNLYLSSALCALSPYVRNSLLGLMRMTSVLTLHHADTILPCADFFNPGWEIEIGTCQGKIENRAAFKRKIDPVVNGITHMERFVPVKEIKTKTPTVTMLSHVWYAKDIKTALLSADIIVNHWGFTDYKLEIYGALDKSPSYTTNCQEIIASKGLRHHVALEGEADPIHVLERTWVFLNSSVSEGLPLALGEAALTGAPVVCTDVGASLRVLTNPDDGSCYSAVVAPNDALEMARAQIKLLALLEEWAPYSDPNKCSPGTLDSSFPEHPTPDDVARITQRMYDQTEARRSLGMRSREIVQKSFSGDRYLREHEQMLWIGKARKDMSMPSVSRPSMRLTTPAPVRISNLASLPVNPRPSMQIRESQISQRGSTQRSTVNEDSLPSLAFGNSSTMPTSIMTDRISSTIGNVMMGEREWIHKPVGMVSIVNVNGSHGGHSEFKGHSRTVSSPLTLGSGST